MADIYELRFPAIEVRQGPHRTLYTFAIDGKRLPLFTAVSRVHRDEDAQVHGYQRPEVLAHIAAIRRYIESSDPMIPNALVIAFDSRVRFEPGPDQSDVAYSRSGTLVIPVDESLEEADKPGWLVDGQQRSAAIRDADVAEFPMCVSAFITDDEGDQRSQFILVNSTRPLPKGLIYELLPTTTGDLPPLLSRKRFPAALAERLNYDEDSPMYQLIQTPTTTTGVIKDNSVLRMIENSLSDGALYRFRDPYTGAGDPEPMLEVLKNFWHAVKLVWPEAWGIAPRKSRLMHGVGIVSLGFVMDAIAEPLLDEGAADVEGFASRLRRLEPVCAWTGGSWVFGERAERRWNELQNTARDIQLLANHLLVAERISTMDSP